MAKSINNLTARTAATLTRPGLYGDGNGLYLRVTGSGSRSWMFRYMIGGKAHTKGLGPLRLIPLAEARLEAISLQRLLRDGIDPLAQTGVASSVPIMSFRDCAEAFINAHAPAWRNAKHAGQWHSTLGTYCYPKIGTKSVANVTAEDVIEILKPIWTSKPKTAGRIRGRIANVLDWAGAMKFRTGENPARWKGHLDKLLPAKSKVRRVQHHAALPWDQVGALYVDLGEVNGVAALALKFCILTAARSGEVLGARWEEIDFEKAIWSVPGHRMKAGRPHRVPLSAAAVSILRELEVGCGELVFPGTKKDQPLSNMAMAKCLARIGRTKITVHGFRSTFRDWAAETTSHANEVVEMALAHTIKSAAEAAYRRGDLMERRKGLMTEWSNFVVDTRQGIGNKA